MPRVSVPPYPIAGGVDDLDEDTPPIIPQFNSMYIEQKTFNPPMKLATAYSGRGYSGARQQRAGQDAIFSRGTCAVDIS